MHTKFLLVFVLTLACVSRSQAASGRIYKGFDAPSLLFPFQVGIELINVHEVSWCGGALIGKTWILTAAHCVENYDGALISVYIGGIRRKRARLFFNIRTENIFIHSEWNSIRMIHDIALLKIPEVKYGAAVRPIRLPESNSTEQFVDHFALAPGWGQLNTNEVLSDVLKWALVKVISNTECSSLHLGEEILESDICVAANSTGVPCSGDSGGPLVDTVSNTLIGVGSIVSINGCGSKLPALYSRTTFYREWIRNITGI